METNKNYMVTHEQLKNLEHFQDMFDYTSGQIKELCGSEKSDIECGFELGRIHSNLRSQYIDMMSLVTDIQKQIIKYGN